MIAIVALPVVGAAPSMAEGTTSVEPAGGAEKAPTEALEPGAYGRAGNRRGLLRWCVGKDVKGGWVTASTSNGRQVRTWKSASVGHSRRLPAMAVVRMRIALVTVIRQLWGGQPHARKGVSSE